MSFALLPRGILVATREEFGARLNDIAKPNNEGKQNCLRAQGLEGGIELLGFCVFVCLFPGPGRARR